MSLRPCIIVVRKNHFPKVNYPKEFVTFFFVCLLYLQKLGEFKGRREIYKTFIYLFIIILRFLLSIIY